MALSLYIDYSAPVEPLRDERSRSFYEVVNRHQQSLSCFRIRRFMCLLSIVKAVGYVS